MQPIRVLQPRDADKAAAILEKLTRAVDGVEKIWGAKPYLHLGEISFKKQKNKAPIPVLDVFFVLGGFYSHNNHYLAIPVDDLPGHYVFEHKQCHYKLPSRTYRKTANIHLVPILRNLAETENHESKMAFKTDPTSGILEMKYRNPGCVSPLVFRFIPAFAGTNLPKGVNPELDSLIENQPIWFLVAPQVPIEEGTWELKFPTVAEDILGSGNIQAVLLAQWVAAYRDWESSGLRNPTSAITSLALELNHSYQNRSPQATRSVRSGTADLLHNLADRVRQSESPLRDFCIPSREYLQSSDNEDQRSQLVTEVEDAVHRVISPDKWSSLVMEYPCQLPEDALTDQNDFADFGEVPGGDFSDISSSAESNNGCESLGGDTESESPQTSRRPSLAAPRAYQESAKRASISQVKISSTSESETEEAPFPASISELTSCNGLPSRTINEKGKVSISANGKPHQAPPRVIPRRQNTENNRRIVPKIVGWSMLVGLLIAVVAFMVVIYVEEYDWMQELVRFYDAIIEKYENFNSSFDSNPVLPATENDF